MNKKAKHRQINPLSHCAQLRAQHDQQEKPARMDWFFLLARVDKKDACFCV
jgi:hypothetical protein